MGGFIFGPVLRGAAYLSTAQNRFSVTSLFWGEVLTFFLDFSSDAQRFELYLGTVHALGTAHLSGGGSPGSTPEHGPVPAGGRPHSVIFEAPELLVPIKYVEAVDGEEAHVAVQLTADAAAGEKKTKKAPELVPSPSPAAGRAPRHPRCRDHGIAQK